MAAFLSSQGTEVNKNSTIYTSVVFPQKKKKKKRERKEKEKKNKERVWGQTSFISKCIKIEIRGTVFTLIILKPQLLTIIILKFEKVQFTTHIVSKNCGMNGKQCRP